RASSGLPRRQRAQLVPAAREELLRERAVAVEDRPAARLLNDVEGDLVPRSELRREQRGGVEGEVAEGVVERAVSHVRPFAAWPRPPSRGAAGGSSGLGGCDADRRAGPEPLAAVAAHVLDQRLERTALLGERVLHARRHLRIRAPLDDALLLEGAQPQRKRARADPCKGALELAEPAPAFSQ